MILLPLELVLRLVDCRALFAGLLAHILGDLLLFLLQILLRFSQLLESVVRVSKVSVRELERRLDLGGGSLNRIFSGRIDLKVRHILLVMDALGLDPRGYFKEAYKDRPPDEPPRSLPDHLLEALAIYAPAGRRPAAGAGGGIDL